MSVKALAASFKQLTSTLDASTAWLLGRNQQVPHLPFHSICKAVTAIYSLAPTLPEWNSATQSRAALMLANSVIEDQSCSIRAYSMFVQAAVAKLHSVNPDPDSHHTHKETQPLFNVLHLPLVSFTHLPPSWPTGHYPLRNPQLYTALNTLVAYFLSRKQNTVTGKHLPGVRSTVEDIATLPLQLLHIALESLKSLSGSTDCGVMAALPHGLTNNLCCLACEGLGPYVWNQETLSAQSFYWEEVLSLLNLTTETIQHARSDADHKK